MTRKLPNHQAFKLSASGAGMIVFQSIDDHLRVLLSCRTSNVGEGLGITGGGYVECNPIDAAEVGTVIQTADEAYRECSEENAGFDEIIDKDSFLERAQPISLIHARVRDINRVHTAAMYALRVNHSEWKRIAALPAGLDPDGKPEREDDLVEYSIRWGNAIIDRRKPERYVSLTDQSGRQAGLEDFCYPHEFHAIAAIAWHHQNGKLW